MKNKILFFYAKLFARTSFFKWNNFLLDLGLRGIGILNYQSFQISGEKHFIDFIKKNYIIETVFDVGANIGQYAGNFVNSERVFSFEPHPKTFKILKEKVRNNSLIQVFELGLSDSSGVVKIYDHSNDEGSELSSIFEKVITDIHGGNVSSTNIKLTTLDDFVKEKLITHISLLKIDTEGNELAVIKGALKTIEHGLVDIIHFEFNEMNTISHVFLRDFIELLPQYNLYRLLQNGFIPINYKKERPLKYEIFAFQNIVAFKKEIDILNKN